MVQVFQESLKEHLKHVYTENHQFSGLKYIQNNFKDNEIVLFVDFSQNYLLKYSSEVQNVHFEDSKQQASLQAGWFYYKSSMNQIECVIFASIPDCLRHGVFAVWTHFDPVLELIITLVLNLEK